MPTIVADRNYRTNLSGITREVAVPSGVSEFRLRVPTIGLPTTMQDVIRCAMSISYDGGSTFVGGAGISVAGDGGVFSINMGTLAQTRIPEAFCIQRIRNPESAIRVLRLLLIVYQDCRLSAEVDLLGAA